MAAVGIVCCAASLALGVTVEAVAEQFPNNSIIGWGFDHDYRRYDYRDYDDDYDDDADDDADYDDYDYYDHDYYDHDYDDHNYGSHNYGSHNYGRRNQTASRNRECIVGNFRERYSSVRDIDIEVGAGKIEVLPYDGGDIEVETSGIDKKLKLYSYMEEDTLKLESYGKILGTNGMSVGTIYLRVPKELTLNEVSMNVGLGELKVESVNARELSIEVGAGSAGVNRFQAAKADISCGAGEVSVTGNVDEELGIENGIGRVICNVSGNKDDYSYDLEGALGNIKIDGGEYSGIGVSEYKEGNGSKQMDIECGLGEIVVNFTHS